jgi:hypothetical protein
MAEQRVQATHAPAQTNLVPEDVLAQQDAEEQERRREPQAQPRAAEVPEDVLVERDVEARFATEDEPEWQ